MLVKRVLLVDDDPDVVVLFDEILSSEGYEVYFTESPQKALELVRANTIPVIFVDINLSYMDGTSLCKKIRRLSRKSIIIAWTGDSSFGRDECFDAGFNDLLHKPASIDKLIAVANQSLILYAARLGILPQIRECS
ncbi:MAG: response regulator [Syntrophobacteraceae bacterium]